jgi:two-component system sensor histidine kinase KdpD
VHGRTVELTIAPDLPPVALDYLMIDQVVTNLIENAVKYTPPTSPIFLTVEPVAGGVQLVVEDRGAGIPPERRARVFDKFYRIETTSRVRGSGLGLSVSRGLVEGHGGRIWVEAGHGPPETPGARFLVELPSEDDLPGTLPPGQMVPATPRDGADLPDRPSDAPVLVADAAPLDRAPDGGENR